MGYIARIKGTFTVNIELDYAFERFFFVEVKFIFNKEK
jgi:hypothetical protein